MKAVIQRVSKASVAIDSKMVAKIGKGVLVLLGIEMEDTQEDISWLSKKIANLRIFNDENNIMNKSLLDISGELMIVSQFTLYAQTKKGNRPSYINAAKGVFAEKIYNSFILEFEIKYGFKPKTGKFGHDMKIEFENDGPVTIIMDSKNK